MQLKDSLIEDAIFRILAEAELDKWQIIWTTPTRGNPGTVIAGKNCMTEIEDSKDLMDAACERMLHEKSWIRHEHNMLYKVTAEGREALNQYKNGLHARLANQEKAKIEHITQFDPLDRRYGVFISSTYLDLREEREAVIRTILEKDCFPLGMELFGADNKSQWQVIEKGIQEADYYLVIVAMRYGSVSATTGISFTEREYDYAISIHKPVIALVLDERARDNWQLSHPKYVDTGKTAAQLNLFKDKLYADKTVAHWSNKDELASRTAIGLDKIIRDFPRPGWIRADKKSNLSDQETLLSSSKTATQKLLATPLKIRLPIEYRQENINPQIEQWIFNLSIYATNLHHNAIKQYVLEITIPKELVLISNQTGKILYELSDNNYFTIQFPQNPEKDEQPILLQGREQRIGSVGCIIHKNNLPSRQAIMEKDILINVYSDGFEKIQFKYPMAEIDPFKLTQLMRDSIAPNKNHQLSLSNDH